MYFLDKKTFHKEADPQKAAKEKIEGMFSGQTLSIEDQKIIEEANKNFIKQANVDNTEKIKTKIEKCAQYLIRQK